MGILSTFRNSVNLINRTSRPLNVRFDGEDIVLQPGENPGFPRDAVAYAKKQNALMGSQHPNDPRKFVCLVGVKDTKDNCKPIDDETMATADKKLERVDRSGEFHGEPMAKVRPGKQTPYTNYEAAVELPGEFDVNRNIS